MDIEKAVNEYLEIVKIYKRFINKNLDKIPKHYSEVYSDEKELIDNIKDYTKSGIYILINMILTLVMLTNQ